MGERYDIVLFGVTGFTGAYVLEAFAKSSFFDNVSFAVAGRSESKIRQTVGRVAAISGADLSSIPVIIADSSDPASLSAMARQARVIINVVGPYRLYGEAVVKAAVENGASHVDVAGEPAFLEKMQLKFAEAARKNGVYVVGACGWDSIPCDLGVNYLKQHFDGGTLAYVEAFAQMHVGQSGYSLNAATYQSLLLGLSQAKNDSLGSIRRAIMPQKLEKSEFRPRKRGYCWWNESLNAFALPFPGADRSVVQRSQYYDAVANHAPPVAAEVYLLINTRFEVFMMVLWAALTFLFVQFAFSRSLMQKYPDFCSGNLFKNAGPSRQQAQEARFTFWVVGRGWSKDQQPGESAPSLVKVSRCDGPDPGYIATSGCALSAALTLLLERDKLPVGGGVFTPTAAFQKTGIYDRLAQFGVTYRIDGSVHASL